MLHHLCMDWMSGQHIQLALNISSFTYYHVLASLPLSAATDSSWKSLQESVGKERLHWQLPSWLCFTGAFSTLVHPPVPSVFWNLESVCFADGHSICSHSQLWIYKFLPVNFSPLSFHRELCLQMSSTH